MVDIKAIDLDKNEVTYADHSKVTFPEFYDAFVAYWDKRIAGETIGPFDLERFMKRGSAQNLKQLIDGKKMEGYKEATLGKKMDPGLMRMIIIMVFVGAIALIGLIIAQKMGLF